MYQGPWKGDDRHKEYPKTRAKDDFWGQVSRTVGGVPVSQDQIDMIVQAIKKGMDFSPTDILLDIGCGNGALASYFYNECAQYQGVDFSAYLIQIAKSNFEKKPTHVFKEVDAVKYIETEPNSDRFTKVLCYGVLTYFSFENAERLLAGITKRFKNVNLIFLGNLPDKERAHNFFPKGKDYRSLLNDPNSPIGIWRSKEEFRDLAHKTGWDVEFSFMPNTFYSAHYRYDAILRRRKQEA